MVQMQKVGETSTMGVIQPESLTIDMTISELDKGLQQILEKQDVPPDVKVKLYSNYLNQYLTMKGKQSSVFRRPMTSTTQPHLTNNTQQVDESEDVEREILQSVPKTMTKQAGLILHRIKQHPELSWNEKGELIVAGHVVNNSNVVDLVNDLLRKRVNFNPIGWEILSTKLHEANIPQDLVRNPDRLAYMMGEEGAVGYSTPRILPHSLIDESIQELDSSFNRTRSLSRGPSTYRRRYRGLSESPSKSRSGSRKRMTRSQRNKKDPYSGSPWIRY